MKTKYWAALAVIVALLAASLFLISCGDEEARGVPVYKGSFLAGSDDYVQLNSGADLNVYSDAGSSLVFGVDGATGAIDSVLNVENEVLPSVATFTVSSVITTGVGLTSTAGEVFEILEVFYFVGTSFDCTGDDCTLDVGTGDDADGFLNCADADLQSTYTDYTGADAGWGGLDGATPAGVFVIGGSHIMSGAETLDFELGGTDPAAGSATVYVVYRKLD